MHAKLQSGLMLELLQSGLDLLIESCKPCRVESAWHLTQTVGSRISLTIGSHNKHSNVGACKVRAMDHHDARVAARCDHDSGDRASMELEL